MHFEPCMFTSELRNRLRADSIPTIFPLQKDTADDEKMHVMDCKCIKFWYYPYKSVLVAGNGQFSETKDHSSLHSQPSSSQTDKQIQTHANLSQSTPRKRKLRQSLSISRTKVARLEDRVKELEEQLEAAKTFQSATLNDLEALIMKFCPEQLAKFITIQIRQVQKKKQGRRYSAEFKRICLQMYFHGPKMYKRVLEKAFCLPSVNTLTRSISSINLTPGINPCVFNILKQKVCNLRGIDKLCVLCVDEMSIKANLFYATNLDKIIGFEDTGVKRNFKPALAATVIMARGLCKNWKQPLAYFFVNTTFSGSELKIVVLQIISELKKINITVVGVTSDLGSNNMRMASLLNISPEIPYFFHENQKIVYLFDIPHLLKSLRNNLITHSCYLRNSLVSWKFVKELYEHDKNYQVRALPKLTDAHVSPTNFDKMKVKYASQIFSHSVYVAMELYIRFKILPPEAETTARFILQMNNLFDILNSSSLDGVTWYQQAYRGSEEQKTFLIECLDFFNNIEFVNYKGENVTNKIKCLRGWKIACNGTLHLWDVLKSHGVEFLFTRRIHQDCLENFFGAVRQRCGNVFNPTPIQFLRAFRQLYCIDMLHSGAENCEDDESSVLLHILDLPNEENTVSQTEDDSQMIMSPVETDYRTNTALEENFTKYICGYLVRKCLKRHSCDVCENYAKSVDVVDDKSLFCYLKAFKHTELEMFGNLYMPSDNFVTFITSLEVLFQNNFRSHCVSDNTVKKLTVLFNEVPFSHPCNCFPRDYVSQLYARVRVFYTLKSVNRNFKKSGKDRKLIIWKNL